jgi:iron complex transport system ATP-binding protein
VTGAAARAPGPDTLDARALTVRLGGRAVLDAVSLTLRRGEVAAIVGPNGAGKSTLMMGLAGLRRPDLGQVWLEGRALGEVPDQARARRIGYLPQAPEIAWRLDVATFVRLGRTAHRGVFGADPGDAAAVDRALEDTGMTPFAGRDITTLSGGERARALIARALAGEPAWLLADEPLTGLDLGHQLAAADLLRRVAAGGVGVVIAVHDLGFAARAADRVILLADGRILADGPPADALAPARLSRAYGVEARWVEGAGGPLLDILGQAPAHQPPAPGPVAMRRPLI